MKKYINGFTALMLLVLSACSVSKDVETPKPALPAEFRNVAAVGDTTSIADIQWKDFFADVTLQQLIDSAIAKNYDMQIAVKNIESSQLLFRRVKWDYVPALALNVTASSNRPSDNSVTGLSISQFGIGTSHVEDYSANLALSWEADIWGKIKNRQRAALRNTCKLPKQKRLSKPISWPAYRKVIITC
jgi:multidrug efflux system outer membrane protein